MTEIIPALHQSTYEMMACPENYVVQEIDGIETPPNIHSDRGVQFHHVMAQYAAFCVREGLSRDWESFDRFASAVGLDAGILLDGFRDGYEVDHAHTLGTEVLLMLDEDLQPTTIDEHGEEHPEPFPGSYYSGKPAAHAGTLDVVILDGTRGKIPDFKSHFRPFTPDTYQSKLYPFMLLQHLPSLTEVEFELIFVRFANARRSITYRREDMPAIMKALDRARARQKQFHILAAEPGRPGIEAIPFEGCVYCPKMIDLSCRWRHFNPYTAQTPVDRLKFAVWAGLALASNRTPLMEVVKGQGELSYTDDNGRVHTASYAPRDSFYYPAVQTMDKLIQWNEASGGDPTLFNGLRISSTQLKPKLKARKRAILDQALADIRVAESGSSFKITTADGEPVDDGAPKYGEDETW